MEIQESIAVHDDVGDDGVSLFELGIMYATGRLRPLNPVLAHVCFNLAGKLGHDRAPELRQEIAADMSADQISAAQRAARKLSQCINQMMCGTTGAATLN